MGAMFGCHLSASPENSTTCVGWLIDQKRRGVPNVRLRVRLAVDPRERALFESVDVNTNTYESIEDMCRANAGKRFPTADAKARQLADRIDAKARRIGWLDSARMPSRIHATTNGGVSTICGHPALAQHLDGQWVIQAEVPRKDHGRSRYCRTCFVSLKKTIPWVPVPSQREDAPEHEG
jgi:hypothetical protein